MNIHEIKSIIENGESSKVEFKRKATTPEKIAKEICAFANTKGGYIFFGVDDNKKIYGIESEKSEMDSIEKACKFFITPPIDLEYQFAEINGKDILIVIIFESKIKPHLVLLVDEETKKNFKRAYIRVLDQSVIASREMSSLLSYQNDENIEELKLGIGDKEKRLFTYLEKYKRATVIDFANLVNISKRRAERLLINLVRAKVLQIQNDATNDYFTLK
jgi:predicted HTH transcriptional regulator